MLQHYFLVTNRRVIGISKTYPRRPDCRYHGICTVARAITTVSVTPVMMCHCFMHWAALAIAQDVVSKYIPFELSLRQFANSEPEPHLITARSAMAFFSIW
jgi:hypothetical protein